MKNWSLGVFFSLCWVTLPIYANEQASAEKAPAQADDDTLAKRHPILALSASVALRHLFGQSLKDAPMAADFAGYGDFALALVAPSALEKSETYNGAALLIVSPFIGTNNESPINPLLLSTSLSHFNSAMRSTSLPYLDKYANQTSWAPFTNTTKFAVPAVAEGLPFLAYYLVKGASFNGYVGAAAKGLGAKTVYVLLDGVTQLNEDLLKQFAGDQAWVKPVAQLETGLVFAVCGYTLNGISKTLTGFVKKAAEDGAKKGVASFGSRMMGLAPTAFVSGAGSLASLLTTMIGEGAGYQMASTVFAGVEAATPKYAPYINPTIGTGLIGVLAARPSRTWLEHQHKAVQSAALGAALSGFVTVLTTLFSLPGWVEEIPSKAWTLTKDAAEFIYLVGRYGINIP